MLHLGDITKISGYTAPIVDVVVGGSPCQDLSVAGKRAGLDGGDKEKDRRMIIWYLMIVFLYLTRFGMTLSQQRVRSASLMDLWSVIRTNVS